MSPAVGFHPDKFSRACTDVFCAPAQTPLSIPRRRRIVSELCARPPIRMVTRASTGMWGLRGRARLLYESQIRKTTAKRGPSAWIREELGSAAAITVPYEAGGSLGRGCMCVAIAAPKAIERRWEY
ncbi:hypothetical protein A0H81_05845 [Grifola frondosa]|uniref:Uncharacterized protein n=1 Tax=Grifola frondosa TaxID=5627 RepID=A0A1C7MAC0_GRIFR|nr:hypothetical protein A0H81_05845 [Grifola frondosa]